MCLMCRLRQLPRAFFSAASVPQDVEVPVFARMACAVLDLQPPRGAPAAGPAALLHSLHALFAL